MIVQHQSTVQFRQLRHCTGRGGEVVIRRIELAQLMIGRFGIEPEELAVAALHHLELPFGSAEQTV